VSDSGGIGFVSGECVGRKLFIVVCFLATGLTTGCVTSHPQSAAVPATQEAPYQQAHYQEAAASALVFDLPMDRGMLHPELARAGRGVSAFMGFDLPTTESYINATDAVSTELGDFHTQELVSVKSGTRVR
jgi:hypothetical protein